MISLRDERQIGTASAVNLPKADNVPDSAYSIPMDVIYLDFNATTPCDDRVLEAMLPFFGRTFANPSSRHHHPGRNAFMALENARKTVALSIGARSATEIVFTSGATESNNLAIKGAARALSAHGRHLITQATEHPAVLEVLENSQPDGFELTVVDVDSDGLVDLGDIARALRPDTILVSVMLANNETGVIQPLHEISALLTGRRTLLHCDAAQGPGKIPVDVEALGVDLLSLSGHKCYGPKGVGALFIRRQTPPLRLAPLLHGGGHENGVRSGTPNVPGAVGLAEALKLANEELEFHGRHMETLRDTFEDRLRTDLHRVVVNGCGAPRLPNTSNCAFPGIDGEALMASLPDLALSTGSACASAHPEPSRVLRAMGLSKSLAASSLRISLGRTTTAEDVERAAGRIAEAAARLER